MEDTFEMFLETADETEKDFISEIHGYLTEKGCKCSIKTAKSGIKMRLYCANIGSYQAVLKNIPQKLKKYIIKAADCTACFMTKAIKEYCAKRS